MAKPQQLPENLFGGISDTFLGNSELVKLDAQKMEELKMRNEKRKNADPADYIPFKNVGTPNIVVELKESFQPKGPAASYTSAISLDNNQ